MSADPEFEGIKTLRVGPTRDLIPVCRLTPNSRGLRREHTLSPAIGQGLSADPEFEGIKTKIWAFCSSLKVGLSADPEFEGIKTGGLRCTRSALAFVG